MEAAACFRGGADAIVSSNTFPSIPVIDPDTLEFEINVDGLVSTGGLGGPAILPLSLAKMVQMTRALPNKSFSGIGRSRVTLPGALLPVQPWGAARSRCAPRPCSIRRWART